MLMENTLALRFLPQFSRLLRSKPSRNNRLFCTAVATQPKECNEVETKVEQTDQNVNFDKLRFRYREFLPNVENKFRNAVKEKLERRDMLRRRSVMHIPEFYVGSILAVTTSDKHVPDKMAKFVGICIQKQYLGLKSNFILRNVIENQGVEIRYLLYSPVIQRIEVLRLEKRLDEELFYLRDAPNEYSTFSMNMMQEYYEENKEVPVNAIKVPLNPRPWLQRWERMDLKGVTLPKISEKVAKLAEKRAAEKAWEKYDLVDEYRKVIPEEEQRDIFSEIQNELKRLEFKHKSEKRRKVFIKPTKQKLF